jgi:3-isopropylmalate/(R)-2-methylmalate dehydratase small subunit
MILYGTGQRVGDHITTGDIIAPEQRVDDPAVLAAHCLATVDPQLAERARPGDILLAGAGFGAGPDPEPAIWALQALGISAVVCASAEDSFVELAQAYGLPVLVSPEADRIAAGALLRIDLERGQVEERAHGRRYQVAPSSAALLQAVRRSQLIARMRQVVEEEGFDG